MKSFIISLLLLGLATSNTQYNIYHAINTKYDIYEITVAELDTIFDNKSVVATGIFIDDRNNSGWTYFKANTSGHHKDYIQTMAVGYLEGYIGYELVYDAFIDGMFYEKNITNQVFQFIANQTLWIESQILLNFNDNYWQLVNTTLSQYYGMYYGYLKAVVKKELGKKIIPVHYFYMTTYAADLSDIMDKFSDDMKVRGGDHCSFLLRMTEDDLYASHDTWTRYYYMVRTYKFLNFSLNNPMVKNQIFEFSSFPGSVASEDDFYILSNNRFVAETTLGGDNDTVLDYIHYNSVPYWIRVTVANWAFDTQQTWADVYFSNRSGTYNNQWLVVDFNRYETYKNNLSVAQDIIWIIEEYYYLTSAQDVTQELLVPQGYVASYNVPYSPAIQNVSDLDTNYTNATRYFLFKKYAPGIQTLENMQFVMRLNNFSDTGDYCEAIACRCDLSENDPEIFGAVDSKIASATMNPNFQAWIIQGPTTELGLPPFNWSNWPDYQNYTLGMPEIFNYNWSYFDPFVDVSAKDHSLIVN